MSNYYPVSLDLRGKKCLVVGGGRVALRKINSLLECGARVTLISRQLLPELADLVEEKLLEYQEKDFQEEDLTNVFLVIAATSHGEVNEEIGKLALDLGKLVNVVDNPECSNFIVPSTYRQGLLSISISTSGASPALAAKISRDLAKSYGKEYAQFLAILQEMRSEIIKRFATQKERKEVFTRLVNSDILDLIREGKQEKVKERIAECIY